MDIQARSERLNVRQQLVLSIFWFSLNIQSAALFPIVIPLQILLFLPHGQVGNAQQAVLLGWIAAIGAIVSLILPLLFGMLSDNNTSKFGRRRPYIAAGTILLVLSALILALADNVAVFILALIINQIGSNAANASYQALLPDRVPKEQRGEASGYMGFMTILGNVGSLGVGALLFAQITLTSTSRNTIQHGAILFYALTSVALIVGGLITLVGVREIRFIPIKAASTRIEERASRRFRRWFVQNWVKPWHEYNFRLIFITRFAVTMGLTLFMTFIEYYFANVAQQTNFVQATAGVAVLALVGAVCSAIVIGIFSDRFRRAPLVCFATILMAMASLAFVIAPGSFPLWTLGILFGVGYGAFTSVDWALAIDSMPSLDTIGKDLALWGASDNLPSIIAPALGGLIITLISLYAATAVGYRVIFAVATVFLLFAAWLILKVRV